MLKYYATAPICRIVSSKNVSRRPGNNFLPSCIEHKKVDTITSIINMLAEMYDEHDMKLMRFKQAFDDFNWFGKVGSITDKELSSFFTKCGADLNLSQQYQAFQELVHADKTILYDEAKLWYFSGMHPLPRN